MPHHQLRTRCIEGGSWSSVVKHDQVHISFPGATFRSFSGLDCDLDCRSSVCLGRRWKVIPRICVYLSIGHYVPYFQAPHLYSLPVAGRGIKRKLQWTRLLFYNGKYSKIVLSFIKIAHNNWCGWFKLNHHANHFFHDKYILYLRTETAIRHEWRVKLVLILSGTMSIMYLVGKDNCYVDCWVSGDQERRVDQLHKC